MTLSDRLEGAEVGSARRFYGHGRMRGRYFEVGADYVRRKRPYDIETMPLPPDEVAWATTKSRAQSLFFWHRNHGLHRREPHPMGKDLGELMRAYNDYHAERYRAAGMEVPGCYRNEPAALLKSQEPEPTQQEPTDVT